jgi:RNA polymerase sigma factor (sigma-70 family)
MEPGDNQLLNAFISQGSENAFEVLVRRHGPLVMGVCRRVLGNSADADDAFQATFFILARKAKSIREGTSLGGWLYRVALRASCDLKAKAALDRRKEREAVIMKARRTAVSADPNLLRNLIDGEINRLPERYRLPVVLCGLENRTYEEAAEELGWTLGRFKRRLSKARELLQSRLARHGITAAGAGLVLTLGDKSLQAAVPAGLAASTAKAAVGIAAGKTFGSLAISPVTYNLMKGVIKTMFLAKVKTSAVVLGVVLAAGTLCVSIGPTVIAAPPNITVTEYAPGKDPVRFSMTNQIVFANGLEIVAEGRNSRFVYRKGPEEPFKVSPIAVRNPKGIAYNPFDGLYYTVDSQGDQILAFRDLAKTEIAAKTGKVAGVKLNCPHGITIDPYTGWIYVINAQGSTLFRFRGIGKDENAWDLHKETLYSRSVTLINGKVYVIGSSAGKIIEIEDFDARKYKAYQSFGKKRETNYGNWETDGLILNTAEYFNGYWYAGSFFAVEFSDPGKDYNKNKFIRFRTWSDFETGNWEDLSPLLPDRVVPYLLTVRPEALYLAAFQPHFEPNKDKVFKIQAPKANP